MRMPFEFVSWVPLVVTALAMFDARSRYVLLPVAVYSSAAAPRIMPWLYVYISPVGLHVLGSTPSTT
jgi:hypothetical protein